MQLEERFYTSTEVAEILGVSLRSVYRYLEEDKIKAEIKTATGRHRFTRQNILDFLYPDGAPKQSSQGNVNSQPSQPTSQATPQPSVVPTMQNVSAQPNNQFQQQNQQQSQSSQVSSQTNQFSDSQEMNTPVSQTVVTSVEEEIIATTNVESNNVPTQSSQQPEEEEVDWLSKFREAAQKHRDLMQKETDDSSTVSNTTSQQTTSPANSQSMSNTRQDEQSASAYNSSVNQTFQSAGNTVNSSVNNSSTLSQQSQQQVESQRSSESISSFGTSQQTPPSQEVSNMTNRSAEKNVYYYTSNVPGLKDLAQQVNRVAGKSNVPYAFTMNAGLSLHKLIRPFSLLHIYAKPSDREFFEKTLGLTMVDSSSQAQLAIMIDRTGVLSNTRSVHGLSVVNNAQLKHDLLNAGEVDLASELNDLV